MHNEPNVIRCPRCDCELPSRAIAYRLFHGNMLIGNWRDMPIRPQVQKEIVTRGLSVRYAYEQA